MATIEIPITEGPSSAQEWTELIVKMAPEENPRARRNIADVWRFLSGRLAAHATRLDPWRKSHWRALKAQLDQFSNESEDWIENFMCEIHTAQHDWKHDETSRTTIEKLRSAQPDQNDLNQLRNQIRLECDQLSPPEREAYLDGVGWRAQITDSEGRPGAAYWTRREILSRSRRNSGPKTAFDSSSERLMRYLTAPNDPNFSRPRLAIATAARVTVDIVSWSCPGTPRTHRALAEYWRSLQSEPFRAPPQP
jgi:hypothetical protein